MSMIGGLFTTIASITSGIVGFFNGGKFATFVIENLFLARNTAHIQTGLNTEKED